MTRGAARADRRLFWRRTLFALAAASAVLAAPPGRAANTPGTSSSSYYESARGYFAKRDYRAAIIQLKNALQADPRDLAARVLLGRAHIAQEDGPAAEQELSRARRDGARDSFVIAPLARAYLLQGKYDQLLRELTPIGQDPQTAAELNIVRGEALLAIREFNNAEASFRSAAALLPNAPEPEVGLARTSIAQDNPAAARRHAERALELAPDNPEAWYMLGEVARLTREPDEAVRCYDQAIEHAPQFTRALLARATVLFDRGKRAAAERDILAARKLDPRSAHAHYLMALVHASRGDGKSADESLREADQILKSYDSNVIRNDAALTLLAGVVNYFRRDYDAAYVWMSRYVETYPSHLPPRRLLASLELRLGNGDRAIRLLQEVIRLVPDDFEALTMYGDALMRSGRKAEAVAAYERAAAISPAKDAHFNELVVIRMLAGQDERAIESLKSAVDRRPGTAALLAAAHMRRGEFAAALGAAEKAVAAAPDDPTGHNLAAGAYLGLKDLDRARASFQSALAADPKFAMALLNLARLERQVGRLAQSKAHYLRYLGLNSDDGMAMIALAEIALLENNPADAVQWLRRGWTRSNARVAAAVRLINLYTELGRASDAIGLAQDLFNERPQDPEAVEALARARLDANLRDAAAETLRHMQEVSVAIGSAPWLQRTAMQQMRARDYEGARASLNAALRFDPKFMPAHVELFRIEMSSNDFRAALARAEQLSARAPDDPTGALLRGDLHMRRRNFPEAIRAYEEALDKQPSAPLALRLYHALNAGGKSGFEFLTRWVRERPDDPAAGRLLGVAYTDAGRIDDAIAAYEVMLRRDAGDPVANNALALLYLRKNDPRAVTAARKAYEAASGEAAFLDTYGWVLVRRGQVEEGLKLLRNAHLRAPDVPEIRYHLAVALHALDQTEEAREELRAALRGGTGFDGAQEARELLRRIGP